MTAKDGHSLWKSDVLHILVACNPEIKMDGVSAASAIFQLLQATAFLANGLYKTCQRLRGAGYQFRDLEKQVRWIESHLQSCQYAMSQIHPSLITPAVEESMTIAVVDASDSLKKLHDICARVWSVNDMSSRIKWVLKYRQPVDATLTGLLRSREHLEAAMQPLLL